jgi:malate/lactate dehydrogenase
VAADLSHCSSNAKAVGYTGDDLAKAVKDCNVVVIPAGVPRKPGMTRDDLFNTNASIVATLVDACAKVRNPRALAYGQSSRRSARDERTGSIPGESAR